MGMSKKPTPLASRTCSDSKSVFMRERLILNVANLRYELDIISILTPLPPAQRPRLAAMPAVVKRKKSEILSRPFKDSFR